MNYSLWEVIIGYPRHSCDMGGVPDVLKLCQLGQSRGCEIWRGLHEVCGIRWYFPQWEPPKPSDLVILSVYFDSARLVLCDLRDLYAVNNKYGRDIRVTSNHNKLVLGLLIC